MSAIDKVSMRIRKITKQKKAKNRFVVGDALTIRILEDERAKQNSLPLSSTESAPWYGGLYPDLWTTHGFMPGSASTDGQPNRRDRHDADLDMDINQYLNWLEVESSRFIGWLDLATTTGRVTSSLQELSTDQERTRFVSGRVEELEGLEGAGGDNQGPALSTKKRVQGRADTAAIDQPYIQDSSPIIP